MEKKYCGHCGKSLLQITIGAEDVVEYYGLDVSKPYWPYNRKTGKRQYGTMFKCPNKRWYNSHEKYTKINEQDT